MLCPRLRFRFSATLLFESEVCTWTRNLVINRDLCSQNRDPNKKGWLASAKLKKITRTAWIWVQLCHNDCPLVWSLKPGWHPNPTKLTVKSWHLTEIHPPIKESYENDLSVVFLAPCELIMQIINSMVVLMASSDKLCTDPGFELQITPTVPHSLFKSHMKNIIWRCHTYLNCSTVSIFSPPLPPQLASKVMVSPRSLEVDSKWQHSCDSKYRVIVLSILL